MNYTPSFTVLVTRPGEGGKILCNAITASGDRAVYFPTLAFEPPQDILLLQRTLRTLNEHTIWIFTSPQAVAACIHDIQLLFPILPTVTCVALGKSTAQALKTAGMPNIICPESAWNSEGVLTLPIFQSIAEKKIALIRGEEGRTTLAETLSARGAEVTHVIAYQRVLPTHDCEEVKTLITQHAIDIVMCTSITALNNLLHLLAPIAPQVLHLSLIVSSDRLKMLAAALGFQTIGVAENAGVEAMLHVLMLKRKDYVRKNT